MTEFTPLSATLGGLLIGLAATLLLLLNGRVAGISGILGRALAPSRGDFAWRVTFLIGLPLGSGLVAALGGGLNIAITSSPAVLVPAGFLVGFGTQLGNGCTSGHGICGLSRGSTRSLAATVTFMGVGVATVFVVRQLFGASL